MVRLFARAMLRTFTGMDRVAFLNLFGAWHAGANVSCTCAFALV